VVYSSVLSNSVASRAKMLVQAMERVAAGDLHERVRPTGNDEIDRLARQFNAMVEQLERHDHTIRDLNANLERKVRERTSQLEATLQELQETQTQLTDVAHRAGMAEIATGVLHNVGNALNSVNISTTVLGERLRRSKLDDLERLKWLLWHGNVFRALQTV
jgi:two-component system, NtrC family, sensor kinase